MKNGSSAGTSATLSRHSFYNLPDTLPQGWLLTCKMAALWLPLRELSMNRRNALRDVFPISVPALAGLSMVRCFTAGIHGNLPPLPGTALEKPLTKC